jgi:signal transduction histidine kinase
MFFVGSLQRLLLLETATYLFPPNLFHIGMILETTIVSFALFYRHRIERKESKKFEKEKEQLKTAHEKQLLQNKLEEQEKMFKHISQEIHDNIGQLLTLAKLNLSTIESHTSPNYQQKVTEVEDNLNLALKDLKQLSRVSDADLFQDKTLTDALKVELERIRNTSVYETQLLIGNTSFQIDRHKEAIILRVCQEAFNNIIKHAEADKITVEINYNDPTVTVKVTDNGHGFTVPQNEDKRCEFGLGIRNMQNRIRQIGGTFKIESQPGTGATVTITLSMARF